MVFLLCLCLLWVPVRASTEEKLVALTFDDGPSGRFTRRLLEGLAQRDAKATFFLCGYRLADYGDEASLIRQNGHEVGLHGYSHDSMAKMDERTLRRELEKRFPKAGPEALQAAIVRSGGYLGQAENLLRTGEEPAQVREFAQAFAGRNALALTELLVPMEKWKRDQVIPVLEQWLSLTQSALVCRSGMPSPSESARLISRSRSSRELMAAIQALQTAILYTKGNVSVAAVCAYGPVVAVSNNLHQ